MLSIKEYPRDYVDHCQQKINTDVRLLPKSVSPEFERLFLNNLVLVLEMMFVHRMRGREGKDGNPLNEVRMVSQALLEAEGLLQASKSINYDESKAVLGIREGARIVLSRASFLKLSDAYFSEMRKRYT